VCPGVWVCCLLLECSIGEANDIEKCIFRTKIKVNVVEIVHRHSLTFYDIIMQNDEISLVYGHMMVIYGDKCCPNSISRNGRYACGCGKKAGCDSINLDFDLNNSVLVP